MSISNSSNYTVISGTSSADSVKNYANYVTIYGGAGDDYIYNEGNNDIINGEAGNDLITITGSGSSGSGSVTSYYPYNVTVNGGTGNDTVYANSSGKEVILYANDDGNDVVVGFGSDDTLKITNGKYTASDDGNDLVVSVGSGSIRFEGKAGSTINIDGESLASGVHDSVDYFYSGGYKTITNYDESRPVTIAAALQGFDIEGDNVSIQASDGTLEIQNVRGKYVTYQDSSGSTFAYSYKGATVGGTDSNSTVNNYYQTIDVRSKQNLSGVYGVIIGGESVNDVIYAGNGGSSLWGGSGGKDTLIGGDGADEFIYKLGSGNDVIQGAGDNDVVVLDGIELSNIRSAPVTSNLISATFSDGGSIKIEGSSNVGLRLSGWTFAADRSTGGWSTK